jgi:hypothetical protein
LPRPAGRLSDPDLHGIGESVVKSDLNQGLSRADQRSRQSHIDLIHPGHTRLFADILRLTIDGSNPDADPGE